VSPAAPAPPRLVERIAFGSCASQERPQPIWDAVLAADPDLFLFLGDTTYADTTSLEVMRAKQARLQAQPGFRRVQATVPLLAVWDDHDYGADDAGLELPGKRESKRAFLELFRDPPDSPRRRRDGLHAAHVFGPRGRRVQVILLDGRWFRSPRVDAPRTEPSATMLGAAQWRWLEMQLRAPARLRIVCSGIPVLLEETRGERWSDFPEERRRLLDVLARARGRTLLLSGDRHLGEIARAEVGGETFVELTSSGLNNARGEPATAPNRHRVGDACGRDNFGTVSVDWKGADPGVTLRLHDVAGIAVRELRLALGDLPGRR
jgi:alkaline phosphatase D